MKENPFAPPKAENTTTSGSSKSALLLAFGGGDWITHSWEYGGRDETVLQKEPFRWRWFATQLVTFVFLIRRTPEDPADIMEDYAALRQFAGQHKRSWIPFGLQSGYALLPIYIGQSFAPSLIEDVTGNFKKRWCVFHAPALLDEATGELHRLQKKSLWGCIYRDFITSAIDEVAGNVMSTSHE